MKLLTIILVNLIFYILVFCFAKYKQKHAIIDIFWGSSFVVLALFTYFIYSDKTFLQTIVLIAVLIWGLRITTHLYRRNINKPEDYRYINIRNNLLHKLPKIPLFIKEFIYIYLLQMILSLVISASFLYLFTTNHNQHILTVIIGTIIVILGFCFEFLGDYQLEQYLQDPNRPSVLQTGLWKYTRHPNYFGEITIWYGIFILALSNFTSIFTIISPLTINTLILFISGVPLLEKQMMQNPNYIEYAKHTNKLIPMLPKK